MCELFWKAAAPGALFNPQPFQATFDTGENSPKLGARKDEPHEPFSVSPISSETVQLNAAFGLLVPPTSLYWSWRQEPSSSRRLTPGKAFASPMIGTFSWLKTAQTWRCSGS